MRVDGFGIAKELLISGAVFDHVGRELKFPRVRLSAPDSQAVGRDLSSMPSQLGLAALLSEPHIDSALELPIQILAKDLLSQRIGNKFVIPDDRAL